MCDINLNCLPSISSLFLWKKQVCARENGSVICRSGLQLDPCPVFNLQLFPAALTFAFSCVCEMCVVMGAPMGVHTALTVTEACAAVSDASLSPARSAMPLS